MVLMISCISLHKYSIHRGVFISGGSKGSRICMWLFPRLCKIPRLKCILWNTRLLHKTEVSFSHVLTYWQRTVHLRVSLWGTFIPRNGISTCCRWYIEGTSGAAFCSLSSSAFWIAGVLDTLILWKSPSGEDLCYCFLYLSYTLLSPLEFYL